MSILDAQDAKILSAKRGTSTPGGGGGSIIDQADITALKTKKVAPKVDQASQTLSSKIDSMITNLTSKNPLLGSFVGGAVGAVKQAVTHPIDTARNIAGGIVSAPETLLRSTAYGIDRAVGGLSQEEYDKLMADEKAGNNPTLSGFISGNKEMGHAIKLGEDAAYRKILGAGGQAAIDLALPEAKILKGGSTLAKIGEGTLAGAGYGVTNAMQSDNPEYLKETLGGAGAGLAFSGAAAGASKLAKVPEILKNKKALEVADNNLNNRDVSTNNISESNIKTPPVVEDVTSATKKTPISNDISDNNVITNETTLSKTLNNKVEGLTPVEYEIKHRDEYQAKAAAYEQTNQKEFWDIATGKKETTDPAFDMAAHKYATDKALAENDIPKLQELMNSKVRTKTAQALSMLADHEADPGDFQSMVNEIINKRETNLKKGAKDDIQFKATKERVTRIKKDGEAMLKSSREMKATELNSFFDSIMC